jgi:two-component sensor histidine kinase
MSERDDFLLEYATVLDDFLRGGEEEALLRAYDLGRKALTKRWDFLDVTNMHQAAILRAAYGAARDGQPEELAVKSQEFLNQVLVPFEIVQRGFVEANTNLREANELLETRVKERTQQLEDALQRERLLRKEIHHRVKNNLQVISAMLFLQSRHVTDPKVVEMFNEGQNRVKSIALINEKLYQSSGMSRIPMNGYIDDLCKSLMQSYGTGRRGVILRSEVDELSLGIDQAVPCALVVNELVSNALKHGLPAGRAGEVTIAMRQGEGKQVHLSVADNGAGLPPNFDARKARSLGVSLVTDLVRQLGGQVAYETDNGTTCRITFMDKTAEPAKEGVA